MLVGNPFAELSATVSPLVIQSYVILMILLVVGGTVFDVVHKKSARYFFQNWRRSQRRGATSVGGARITTMAVQTVASEVLTSSEFCNPKRRIAHLLGMYGFIAFAASSFAMVFWYLDQATTTPAVWPLLWVLGALMVCIGGGWFWFFIRADVNAEGHSPFRLVRADLFILSLLGSTGFGLLWAVLQAAGAGIVADVFLVLFIITTTVLFAGVPWSKFSHMFFKPAAALQKRVEQANGTRSNLPAPADRPSRFGKVQREPSHY